MIVRFSTRISGAIAALLLASVVAPAAAHHSAAPFDMTRQVSVTGTVERWVWSNPHSWLYITVTKANGTKEVWGLEAGSAGMMARQGWNSRDMKPGDRVTVSAHPSRNGRPVGLIREVRLPSGRVLGGGFGAPPPGVNGPPPAPRY